MTGCNMPVNGSRHIFHDHNFNNGWLCLIEYTVNLQKEFTLKFFTDSISTIIIMVPFKAKLQR